MKQPYPDTETTMDILRGWMDHHDAIKKLMDGLEKSVGIDSDGPLHETVWKLFDAYTNALSELIGDGSCYLAWYHSENDCGKRGLMAGHVDTARRIWTLEDLAWLIESGNAELSGPRPLAAEGSRSNDVLDGGVE